jgi:proline dehydrogenase
MTKVSFDNTEVAFKHKSDAELKQAKWLFSLFKYKWMVKYGPGLTSVALRLGLPIKPFVRKTIFGQFCGGETIEDCGRTGNMLYSRGVGSILDYSAEGVSGESTYNENAAEIKRTILAAKNEDKYPFAVFKCTAVANVYILKKASKRALSDAGQANLEGIRHRIEEICHLAVDNKVRLLIDAEESWFQDIIDDMVLSLMKTHNKSETWIYNTLQMYRVDRLDYLKKTIAMAKANGFRLGYKLVRGAYMEKERERALAKDYPSPIQPDKESTDRDFNLALSLCFENRDVVSTCLGTHNEESSNLLTELMEGAGLTNDDERFCFAQLYGMSDHISFNLASEGYNVAKYLPYGPIVTVLPYLGRRAQENSSVAGQVGREMSLIVKELKRRRSMKN